MAGEPLLGNLPNSWEYKTLGAVCHQNGAGIQTGPFGSQLHASDYVSAGIPSIMPQNIGDNWINVDGIARVSLDDANRLSRYLVREGDIVYSRRGDVEKRALIRAPEDGWLCGTGCLRVRVDRNVVEPKYASYCLGHPLIREWIVRHAHGATMPNLNTSILSACPFVVPPLPEQRVIAHILGTLDDKIELNRRMNETLEAMARAIFKDWFVDFGPTRAKIEGRDPYLAPEIWDLFPDKLGEDGKPEGWEVFRLNQIAEHHTEVLSPAATPDTEFEHFSLPAFDAGRRPAIDKGLSIKSNKTLVPKRAVLLSKLNPEIPRVWLPEDPCQRQQISSTEFLALVPRVIAGRALLFCLFSDDRFREMLQSMVTGTSKSHQRISPKSLNEREVIAGNVQLFSRFEELANYLLAKTLANRAEARTLAQTRDLLLPRLMSGEIRVSDADKIVQEFT